MQLAQLMTEIGRLGVELQRLAAIGAALRLKLSAAPAPPAVEAALREAILAVLPGSLDDLTPDEVQTALNVVVYQMDDARELVNAPARPPVWSIDDPSVLQSMGDLSRMLPRRMLAFSESRPGLAKALAGRFLDVGTGVAAIALEAAALSPTLKVVGLDIWGPSLQIARANVAASPFVDRIEIREQSVTDLDEKAAYTLAFLAAPFMPKSVVEAALDRLAVAVASDGYLVVSVYIPPSDPVMGSLTVLRRVHNGGDAWTTQEMGAALAARGFVDVETQPGPPARGFAPTLIYARRA